MSVGGFPVLLYCQVHAQLSRNRKRGLLTSGCCFGARMGAWQSLNASAPSQAYFEVSKNTGRIHFHLEEDGGKPLGLSLPAELLSMSGTSETINNLLEALDGRCFFIYKDSTTEYDWMARAKHRLLIPDEASAHELIDRGCYPCTTAWQLMLTLTILQRPCTCFYTSSRLVPKLHTSLTALLYHKWTLP